MAHMSYTLNSLKKVIWGIIQRSIGGVFKEDTRGLDHRSYRYPQVQSLALNSKIQSGRRSLRRIRSCPWLCGSLAEPW